MEGFPCSLQDNNNWSTSACSKALLLHKQERNWSSRSWKTYTHTRARARCVGVYINHAKVFKVWVEFLDALEEHRFAFAPSLHNELCGAAICSGILLFQREWLLQTGRISVRELWIWKEPCDKQAQIRHLTSEWDELHMDLCAEVNGFLLDAGGGLIAQVRGILLGLWFISGLFDMTRILSVLATIMLFNILGLILLQGTSDVGKLSQTFIRLRVQVYIPHLLIYLSPLISNMCLLQCKESSMPWSFRSSTLEVSQPPAGCLDPGDPRIQSCLRLLWQSPDPSAALVIPTRTKSASTTVTWTSSGSTPPSKTCIVKCEAIKLQVCLIVQSCTRRLGYISGLAKDVSEYFFSFLEETKSELLHLDWYVAGLCNLNGSHAVKLTQCGKTHPEAPDAVMVQVMASPAESNARCEVTEVQAFTVKL